MNLRQHKISIRVKRLEAIFNLLATSQSSLNLKKTQSYLIRWKMSQKQRNQVKDSFSSILRSTMPSFCLNSRRALTLIMQFLNTIMRKTASQLPLASLKAITSYSGMNSPTDLSSPKVYPTQKSKSSTRTFSNCKMIFQAKASCKSINQVWQTSH